MRNLIPVVNEIQIEQPYSIIKSLEEMIQANITSISRLTVEKRKQKEMLDDSCNNDIIYKEHADKAKEAVNIRNATKAQIMKQPSNLKLANNVKTVTAEIKGKKSALSDYLLEYKRLTQATQLEMFDGSTIEIVETAHAVRR